MFGNHWGELAISPCEERKSGGGARRRLRPCARVAWNFMKLLELVRRLLRFSTQRFSFLNSRATGWLWYKTEQKQRESRVGMRRMWSFLALHFLVSFCIQ